MRKVIALVMVLGAVLGGQALAQVAPQEKEKLKVKVIGVTFKVLAKVYTASTDIEKLKAKNIQAINTMSDEKFRKRYDGYYNLFKKLPQRYIDEYKLTEDMSKQQVVKGIRSLDKHKIYQIINAIPNATIAESFSAYLRSKKEAEAGGKKSGGLMTHINNVWKDALENIDGKDDSEELAPDKIKIVASFYPVYIMAKNVAKDVPGVTVERLARSATGCLHDYAVTTNDMKKLAGAQVLVANGAGMESFLDKLISRQPQLKIARLSDGIPLIKGQGIAADNPHVWVSISYAIIEVENLGRALAEFDPEHKTLYQKNAADYTAKLGALKARMRGELAPYRGRQIVTFHEAFSYFAREFGLRIAAVVEREPGSEPSAKELAGTIELIKKNRIAVVFSEPQYPARATDAIARETKAKVYVLDPAVTGPDDPDAYLEIMETNLKTLKEAFHN